jgi:mannose-1-phosphate guanylyltransferase
MLLGAGFGTRLRPLTDERPKPLVPVGDRPIIAHHIDRLRAELGRVPIVVNAHHQAGKIVEFLKCYDPAIQVIVEPELRGTAGGIGAALYWLGSGPILVVNADVICVSNYLTLLNIIERGGLVLGVAPLPAGQGTVGVDATGHVARIRGEIFGVEASGGNYVGVAAIGPDLVLKLPSQGCLVGDFMLPLLRAGTRIRVLFESGPWADIGSLKAYSKANFDWLHRKEQKAWVGAEAILSTGVELLDAIVGQGAQVSCAGLLHRVIIWPWAHVDAPLADSIVMTSGLVVPIPRD